MLNPDPSYQLHLIFLSYVDKTGSRCGLNGHRKELLSSMKGSKYLVLPRVYTFLQPWNTTWSVQVIESSIMQKNAVFWNLTPCGSSKNRRFGGSITSVLRSVLQLLVTTNDISFSLICSSWWWRRYVPPKRRFFYKYHMALYQRRRNYSYWPP
jgi:hypothetical protein